jgi:hypothetical protein
MNSSMYPSIDYYVPCEDGVAAVIPDNPNYTFRCKNVSGKLIGDTADFSD